MSFAPSTPITGAAVVGFTSPTYTIVADTPPSQNAKQYAVTALGGTQANVETHTVSKPFTLTFFRPQQLRVIPGANPLTGILKNIPLNTYKLITRKGALPAANQPAIVAKITTIIEVPAGADSYEPEDLKAMVSSHFGAGFSNASGIADTILSGIL